jgi:hypothetical protein
VEGGGAGMNTCMDRLVMRVERSPWSIDGTLGVVMYLRKIRSDRPDQIAVAQVTFRDLTTDEAEGTSPAPSFSLNQTDAQRLMDELYAAGVRPTEAAGSVGQLGAVQAHLQDMRKLVFEGMERKAVEG